MIEPTSDAVVEARKNGRFFFSSRRRHTRFDYDWSSDVCSSDLDDPAGTESPRSKRRQWCSDAGEEREWQCSQSRLECTVAAHELKVLRDEEDEAEQAKERCRRSEERRVGKECRSRCGPST